MNFVIVGGTGFLGSYFIKNLKEFVAPNKIFATYRENPLSNTEAQWVYVDLKKPETFANIYSIPSPKTIICLASLHHPDQVKNNKQEAFSINITSLSILVNGLSKEDRIYYASSDTVYGESKELQLFTENELPLPLNEYGTQKLLAEKIVLSVGGSVFRYPFLIGPSKCEKKHFYDQIVNSIKTHQQIELLNDSYRSALDFNAVARFSCMVMQKYSYCGIVNICGDQALSKYDVGLLICKQENLDSRFVVPVSFANQDFFAEKRAQHILMSNQKLKHLLGIQQIQIFQ